MTIAGTWIPNAPLNHLYEKVCLWGSNGSCRTVDMPACVDHQTLDISSAGGFNSSKANPHCFCSISICLVMRVAFCA